MMLPIKSAFLVVNGRSILTTAVLLAAGSGVIGCTTHVDSWPGVVSTEPMVIDPAMDRRDWTPSSAIYQNKAVEAGEDGVVFIPAYNMPQFVYPLVDAPISLGNFVMLPFTLIFAIPAQPMKYQGEVVETSYHAQPPLPEGPVPMSQGVRDTGGGGAAGTGAVAVAASPGAGSQTGVPNSSVGASGAGAPTVGQPNSAVPSPVTPAGQGGNTVAPSGSTGAVTAQPGGTTPGAAAGVAAPAARTTASPATKPATRPTTSTGTMNK